MPGDRFARIVLPQADEARLGRRAIEALAEANESAPWMFNTDTGPVRLERDADGDLVCRELTPNRMAYELSEAIEFVQRDSSGELRPARQPARLATHILAMPDLPFPRLTGLYRVPVFGPSGKLLASNGYDLETGLFLDLPPDLEGLWVDQNPSKSVIEGFIRIVRKQLLGDFPFDGPSDVAHAFAALLQFFVRPMIAGQTPLYVISKPTPGTGASLLAQVYGEILGSPFLMMDECRSDDEWSRRILAAGRATPSAILIDNVSRPLDSSALAAAITGERFSGRIVGTSDIFSAKITCAWFLTGNNPRLSFELLRRSVRIRLDARSENPEQGRTFRHPHLRTWVKENRAYLVLALLTMAQAWIAAGKPRGQRGLGGFEGWSDVVGGILEVVGIPGFLENRDEHRAAADCDRPFREFVGQWAMTYGPASVCVRELFDLADDLDLGNGTERARRIRLGKLLERHQDRAINGVRLTRPEGAVGGSARWRLEPLA